MNRIDAAFKELKRTRRKGFIAFLTAGYPSLAATEKLVLALAHAGVDLIELGVPFSDPMADGPIIQEASQEALRRGVTLQKIVRLVARLRRKTDIPLCLMTYYNPVFCFPEARFIKDASCAGVDGIIIPDLPPEEGRGFMRAAALSGLAVIPFVSPTTSLRRAKFIASGAQGFIYYVSLTGVTGPRQSLPKDLIQKIRVLKKITSKPICVGFGVSTLAQVRQLQNFAEGVIVGSAIVKKIKQYRKDARLPERVAGFVKGLTGV
ncbi:MAG: tryptophan synthase subunit alpha [Candidatus Omnitrophica bacterium]|nr:tryptophan synthase subunit alpha [Candidatus Omnitrophota bacterium]